MKWAFAVTLAILPAAGQPLSVYSEFAKIDAQGHVTAPDAPREILSPALVRNAFTSFQVVVQLPPSKPYILRIGQNPDNAARVTFYRLKENQMEPAAEPINGNATQVFWMDVWIDKDAPVRRIKVEPQLYIDGDWVIYPMEMRVRENVVPEMPSPNAHASTATAAPAASPFDILRAYLCGAQRSAPASPEATTAETFHVRNARQDVALASLLSPADREDLRKRMGGCNARTPENPEAYLRLRDYFVTPLWMKVAHGN
ncbi:MAG TPA: hypothetical protein VGR73_02165 [Bryobacteraceae bacterium]|nr:hypothetical protein [Bryobacteraceae bacterium]